MDYLTIKYELEQAQKEAIKAELQDMSLPEIRRYQEAASAEAVKVSMKMLYAKAYLGRLLKNQQDALSEKEYKSFLRKNGIKIADARTAIAVFEKMKEG